MSRRDQVMACGFPSAGTRNRCADFPSAVVLENVRADSMRSSAARVSVNDDAPAAVPHTAMLCPAALTATG